MARPTSYTSEKASSICTRLAEGESLRSICADEDMPAQSTVYRWLEVNDEFREQYARARVDQGDTDADRVTDIAEKIINGVIEPNAGRVAIDAFKWSAGKRNAKKYGDRLQLANDPDDPIGSLTDEQIEAKLAELMSKAHG